MVELAIDLFDLYYLVMDLYSKYSSQLCRHNFFVLLVTRRLSSVTANGKSEDSGPATAGSRPYVQVRHITVYRLAFFLPLFT